MPTCLFRSSPCPRPLGYRWIQSGGREYGGEDQRGEVRAVPGSFPDLTGIGRRFERGDRPCAPVPPPEARPASASQLAGRGCTGRGYRLWPLLCGGLL